MKSFKKFRMVGTYGFHGYKNVESDELFMKYVDMRDVTYSLRGRRIRRHKVRRNLFR